MTVHHRPHLLYVAWGFPPSRGGGVYRALATANSFAQAGWRVTVLTVERAVLSHSVGIDPTLEHAVDPRVVIERIPSNVAPYETDLRTWSRTRARYLEIWNKVRSFRDHRIFPDETYGAWRIELERAALRIHSSNPVELVLGTANPNVDFIAGFILNRRYRVPYVMDYRDAWQLNVFTGERSTSPSSSIARWERRLVSSAKEIWFVNQPIRDWHAELYPSHAHKMHVVMNGYDSDLLNVGVSSPHQPQDGLTFGYVGTVSPAVPLRQLFKGWALARRSSEVIRRSEIRIYGYLGHANYVRKEYTQLFAEYADQGVRYCGPLGKASIAETYASLDALLLALGTGKYVTSGKVFEYAATGLPIVSVHDPRNATTDVMKGYPRWAPVEDLSPQSISDALIKSSNMVKEDEPGKSAEARRWATRYERSIQLQPRVAALTAMVRRTPLTGMELE